MQYFPWHADFVLVEYLPIFAITLFIYEGTSLSENKAGKLMSAVFQSPWNAGLHHPFRSYWVESPLVIGKVGRWKNQTSISFAVVISFKLLGLRLLSKDILAALQDKNYNRLQK